MTTLEIILIVVILGLIIDLWGTKHALNVLEEYLKATEKYPTEEELDTFLKSYVVRMIHTKPK